MPKNTCRFTETEVARAIRAADRAGQRVSTIQISRDGEVTIHVAKEQPESEEEKTGA